MGIKKNKHLLNEWTVNVEYMKSLNTPNPIEIREECKNLVNDVKFSNVFIRICFEH